MFAKNFARNHEKKSTWNIRYLVDNSFVPSSKQTSILYCKLTDFNYYLVITFNIRFNPSFGFQ